MFLRNIKNFSCIGDYPRFVPMGRLGSNNLIIVVTFPDRPGSYIVP